MRARRPRSAICLRGSRLIVPATEAASWRSGGGAAGLRYDHRSGVLDGSIPFVPYAATADAFLVAIDSGAQPVVALVPREDVAVVNAGNVDGSMASRLTFARHAGARRARDRDRCRGAQA